MSLFDKATHIHPPIKVWGYTGGTAGDHTVTGITTDDKLLAVVGFVLSGALVKTWYNSLAGYSILADGAINNTGGTNNTAAIMFCMYSDWNA